MKYPAVMAIKPTAIATAAVDGGEESAIRDEDLADLDQQVMVGQSFELD